MRGYITDSGAPGGLRLDPDLPEPEPAPNQLVMDVHAFSLNRGETYSMERRRDGWRPGQDVGGVVVRAAEDGSGPAVGTRVVATVNARGWGERVAAPTDWVAPLPDAVSFEQAATLGVAGTTALRGLRLGGDVLGREVLVTGATGAVGMFAIQLAKASGARVTAQVSAPERGDLARELGADAVTVDLDEDDLPRFHLVLDGVGGPTLKAAMAHLAPAALVVLYGVVGGPAELGLADFQTGGVAATITGLAHYIPEETKGEDIGIMARLIADGRLAPLIGMQRPFEEIHEALDALRNRRVRGKAVLTVSH